MNEIDEEEGSAGPANVTGGVENFSPMLFGPISRIKSSDNKKKRKKKKMKKKTLREILEQNIPPVPQRNIRRHNPGKFAQKGLAPAAERAAEDDTRKAIKRTHEDEAKRNKEGRVPPPGTRKFGEFIDAVREIPSGKSELDRAIEGSSMKNKDAEQRKKEMNK